MNNELRSGDIAFGPIGGFVPGFFPVALGQLLLFIVRGRWAAVRQIGRWWRIRHVGVIDHRPGSGGAYIIQAMPGGVERVPIRIDKHLTGSYVFVRPDYEASGVEPRAVAVWARSYIGTPYNFLTYAKLAAGAFRMRATEALLTRWISTRRDMMCSQHADQSLADASYHVFNDGRLPQDVVPAELYAALVDKPCWILKPGHPQLKEWTWHRDAPSVW